jgi:hypothetical protein
LNVRREPESDGRFSANEWQLSNGKTPRFFGIDPAERFLFIANNQPRHLRARRNAAGFEVSLGEYIVQGPRIRSVHPLPPRISTGTCYKVVLVDAPPEHDQSLTCLSCGAPLQNRQGKFA